MLPSPSKPSVRPCSSKPVSSALFCDQIPSRVLPAAAGILRPSDEGEGEDVFGDGAAVAAGGDGDPHAGVGGGVEVDVVRADPVAGDDPQAGRVGDLVTVEGLGAEHHGLDDVAHLLVGDGGRPVAEVHLAKLAELGKNVGVDGVGDVGDGHG